jgi:ATP-dependent DNA helicase DinG
MLNVSSNKGSELQAAVMTAFSHNGSLAQHDPHYRERPGQQQMALAVTKAIDERQTLVVEAGTGVGKTFAYLVPALLSNQRALISTATKNLQDQLFLRDLPRLRDILQLPIDVALLKGRASYLCLHRLQLAGQRIQWLDRQALRDLAAIEQWSHTTTKGDLAEIQQLDEQSSAISLVTSSKDNCLGHECPQYSSCHVFKARRAALAADVVVVNHHLFFADMALRDTQMAPLLPSVDIAIFDEAHQLVPAGLAFLGRTLSSNQLIDFGRDLEAAGLQHARGLVNWQQLAQGCDESADLLRQSVATDNPNASIKLAFESCAQNLLLMQALEAVMAHLTQSQKAIQQVIDAAPDFTRLAERASELIANAQRLTTDCDPDQVRWIEMNPHHVRLIEAPLNLKQALQTQIEASPKAWVFTSATLGHDEQLSWFTQEAGLNAAHTLQVPSPFDYQTCARRFIPKHLPKPNEAGHSEAVADLALQCGHILKGKTVVLTTTLRALKTIGEHLQNRLNQSGDNIEVLVQGSRPKRQLLTQFLNQPQSILVGSHSFWEGIDIAGNALQCVIIDKLPFPPLGDPLVKAKSRYLESLGRNPFADYFLAETAIALKQGAGRLIRRENDQGLLIIADSRLRHMSYARQLRAALPPMKELHDLDEAMAWLVQLSS